MNSFTQSSRLRHTTDVDSLFRPQLQQLCDHTVVFAVQRSYEEMGRSMFYRAKAFPLPTEKSQPVRYLMCLHHVLSKCHAQVHVEQRNPMPVQPLPADEAEALAAKTKVSIRLKSLCLLN